MICFMRSSHIFQFRLFHLLPAKPAGLHPCCLSACDISSQGIPYDHTFLCPDSLAAHLKWTDVFDYVVTRYSHLLDIPESIYNVFPAVYNHCVNKFTVIYNTPKCLHCFTDDLFAMIKKEVDSVIKGENPTKFSVYSCHDTSIMRRGVRSV